MADGEDLGVAESSFDAVVCRLGLMFFPDPLQGLREMHRALRPGGGVCTMVFSRPDSNPCLRILMATALEHAGLPARDPFQPGGLLSLGRPGLIDELFRSAGFHDVATTALDAPFRVPTVDDYLNFVRTFGQPDPADPRPPGCGGGRSGLGRDAPAAAGLHTPRKAGTGPTSCC